MALDRPLSLKTKLPPQVLQIQQLSFCLRGFTFGFSKLGILSNRANKYTEIGSEVFAGESQGRDEGVVHSMHYKNIYSLSAFSTCLPPQLFPISTRDVASVLSI